MTELPTDKDLLQLPHRAVVAFACRCARRVQPKYTLWMLSSSPDPRTQQASSLEKAIHTAEDFANGIELAEDVYEEMIEDVLDAGNRAGADSPSYASSAAVHAAKAAAFALRSARSAAHYANPAPHETFPSPDTVAIMAAHAAAAAAQAGSPTSPMREDYHRLAATCLAPYPELGETIDCHENGPLGNLWNGEPPHWYRAVVSPEE